MQAGEKERKNKQQKIVLLVLLFLWKPSVPENYPFLITSVTILKFQTLSKSIHLMQKYYVKMDIQTQEGKMHIQFTVFTLKSADRSGDFKPTKKLD
jgi:hypothetical protein